MNRPNVLIVLADQWRAQSTGYAGDLNLRTPHLDALAARSLNLTHAVSGCPVCSPARASFLTGLRPPRHGLLINDLPLDPTLDSFPKRFAAAGYDTAYVGKWHVDGHGRLGRIPPDRRHGFAYWKACECTHQYHSSPYWDGDADKLSIWPGYDAQAQTNDLCTWLANRTPDRPFLAVLAWGPPHDPYETAPPEYTSRFRPEQMHLPPNLLASRESQVREYLAGYCSHIAALDDCLAQVLVQLDQLRLAQDTIVVFTSDHGDLLGAHGLYGKQGPWDESLCIPFLIRWPGRLAAGARLPLVFDLMDIGPTLCGLAQLDAMTGIDGRDLSACLRNHTLPGDNSILYGSYIAGRQWENIEWRVPELPLEVRTREARGVRTERWTYIEDRNGPWLLYDNVIDPFQTKNLVGLHEHAAMQASLAALLRQQLADAGDNFATGEELLRRHGWDPAEAKAYWTAAEWGKMEKMDPSTLPPHLKGHPGQAPSAGGLT